MDAPENSPKREWYPRKIGRGKNRAFSLVDLRFPETRAAAAVKLSIIEAYLEKKSYFRKKRKKMAFFKRPNYAISEKKTHRRPIYIRDVGLISGNPTKLGRAPEFSDIPNFF